MENCAVTLIAVDKMIYWLNGEDERPLLEEVYCSERKGKMTSGLSIKIIDVLKTRCTDTVNL